MSRKSHLSRQRSRRISADNIIVQEVVRQELSHYSGPLPQAEQMEHYEQICPGYAKELLEMAKSAQDHSQQMDRDRMDLHKSFTNIHQKQFGRGQIIGGILAFSAISAGTIFAVLGYPTAGGGLIFTVMSALGGAFVWNKRQESKTGNTSGASDQETEQEATRIEG